METSAKGKSEVSLSSTGTCVARTLRGRNVIFAVLRKPCAQLVGVAELDVVAVIRFAVVVLADLEAVKRPGLQVLDGLLGRLLLAEPLVLLVPLAAHIGAELVDLHKGSGGGGGV